MEEEVEEMVKTSKMIEEMIEPAKEEEKLVKAVPFDTNEVKNGSRSPSTKSADDSISNLKQEPLANSTPLVENTETKVIPKKYFFLTQPNKTEKSSSLQGTQSSNTASPICP